MIQAVTILLMDIVVNIDNTSIGTKVDDVGKNIEIFCCSNLKFSNKSLVIPLLYLVNSTTALMCQFLEFEFYSI